MKTKRIVSVLLAVLIIFSLFAICAEGKQKLKPYRVPGGDTSFKAYAYYTAIAKGTPQWNIQKRAYTDKYGCRRIGQYYLVAVGSYYSKKLGDRFKVTLSTGKVINVYVCDFKADRDTDPSNMYSRHGNKKCVLEFYVAKSLYKKAKLMGDCSYIPGLKGKISKMEKYC